MGADEKKIPVSFTQGASAKDVSDAIGEFLNSLNETGSETASETGDKKTDSDGERE